MPKLKPSIRPSETYTEPNFLRVYTAAQATPRSERLATIEHLSYQPKGDGKKPGWNCATICDGEAMSKEDAMFIARSYAVVNDVPVIYEAHGEG
jgi:hypothetical protein